MSTDSPGESRHDSDEVLRQEQRAGETGGDQAAGNPSAGEGYGQGRSADAPPGGSSAEPGWSGRQAGNGRADGVAQPPGADSGRSTGTTARGSSAQDGGRNKGQQGHDNGKEPLPGMVTFPSPFSPPPQRETLALRLAYKAGVHDAHMTLWRLHERRFRAVARALCGGEMCLEDDVFQEHHLQLLSPSQRTSYDATRAWGPWASCVLRTTILLMLRRQRRGYYALVEQDCQWLRQQGMDEAVLEKLLPVRYRPRPSGGRRNSGQQGPQMKDHCQRKYYSEPWLRNDVEAALSAREFDHWWPLIRSVARHRMDTTVSPSPTTVAMAVDEQLEVDELVSLQELEPLISKELQKWKDQDAFIFILRFVFGLKYDTIAELVDLKRSSVAKRVKTIKDRLRLLLQRHGFDA